MLSAAGDGSPPDTGKDTRAPDCHCEEAPQRQAVAIWGGAALRLKSLGGAGGPKNLEGGGPGGFYDESL